MKSLHPPEPFDFLFGQTGEGPPQGNLLDDFTRGVGRPH